METKICTTCQIEKELSLFTHVRKVNKLGQSYIYYNTKCRKCKNKYKEEYLKRPENAEKNRDRMNRKNRNKKNKMLNDADYAQKVTERNLSWRAKNKEKLDISSKKYQYQKKSNLKKYGLTLERYNDICKEQDNKCIICTNPTEILVVDHCHKSGNIRGLICFYCNTGLGYFKDEIETLKRAILYLQKEPMIKNVD